MDYDVRRCSRKCDRTDRELQEGEVYFSVLKIVDGQFVRSDYCEEAWDGPPEEGVIAWWRAQVPARDAKVQKLAPSDVLLNLFQELENETQQADVRYVLTLLLVRRRLFRLEHSQRSDGQETLEVYCPRLDQRFQIAVQEPQAARIEEIQAMLEGLLFAGAE